MVAANEPKDSEAALQVGLGLAQALRARVRVVHVGSTEEGAIAELLHAADTHPSQTILAEAARPFEEAGLEVSRVAVANASGVAEELAKAAEAADADIILVGPSGEPDVRDWLLGSVAEGVLHHTAALSWSSRPDAERRPVRPGPGQLGLICPWKTPGGASEGPGPMPKRPASTWTGRRGDRAACR